MASDGLQLASDPEPWIKVNICMRTAMISSSTDMAAFGCVITVKSKLLSFAMGVYARCSRALYLINLRA